MKTDPMPRFMEWLREGGAELPKVRVVVREDGQRAVRATGRIEAGEAVVRIPRALILTDAPRGDRLGLTARVLRERFAAASPFLPWLDVLPTSFDDIPANFGLEARALLEGSSALHQVVGMRETFEADYEAVIAIPELAKCTWAEFSWARCVAATRAFGIRDAQPPYRVLVPMVDMINHSHDPPCRWTFDPDSGTFVVETLRSIEPGEEISLTYRRECVCRFLVPYGFVPDAGAIDCVTLGLRVDVETESVRQTMASDEHALADAASTQRVLDFFRMAHSGQQPVTLDAPVSMAEPVSLDEEARSLAALVAHCDAALERLAVGRKAHAGTTPSSAAHAVTCSRVSEAEARALAFHRDLGRAALAALPTREALEQAAGDERYAVHAPYFRALLRLHDVRP